MYFNCSNKVIKDAKYAADECLNCGLCTKNCEMLSHYYSSPRELFEDIYKSGRIDPEKPYSCNLCGKCTEVCPKNIKLERLFIEMRRDIISLNSGRSPIRGHNAVESHQRFGFSKLFTASIGDFKAGYTKRVFIPGCSLSSYSPYLVKSTIEYLQEKLPGTGAILMCCGKPTKDMGQFDKFKERYSKLQNEFEKLGIEEVITACQNCYVTIKENSPSLRVRSLWEIIPQIGLPEKSIGVGRNSDIIFSIHDACPTRFNSEIQDGIRWIINELGYKIQESRCSRELTNCCGFGGMAAAANPELAKRVIKKAADNTGSDYVITYCASCRDAMAIGGRKAVHILNLIFNNEWNSKSNFMCLSDCTFKKWINRYKIKDNVKNWGNDKG